MSNATHSLLLHRVHDVANLEDSRVMLVRTCQRFACFANPGDAVPAVPALHVGPHMVYPACHLLLLLCVMSLLGHVCLPLYMEGEIHSSSHE